MGILVTGGAGYIGSHVASALVERDQKVVVLDSFIHGYRDTTPGIEIIEADISDTVKLIEACKRYDITEVFHFAGFKNVSDSMRRPQEYFRNNVEGLLSMLDNLGKLNLQNFIFSSSCSVYGDIGQSSLVAETTPTNPMSVYGDSKLIGEMIVNRYSELNKFRSINVRYFNVVGSDSSWLRGEDLIASGNLVPLLVRAVLSGRPAILGSDKYQTPDGTAIRDYVHISDIVSGHLSALDYLRNGGGVNVLNLGSGKGSSVKQVVAAVSSACGLEVPHAFGERRDGDPAYVCAEISLAKDVLRWSPQFGLAESVQSSWDWFNHAPFTRRESWMKQLSK